MTDKLPGVISRDTSIQIERKEAAANPDRIIASGLSGEGGSFR